MEGSNGTTNDEDRRKSNTSTKNSNRIKAGKPTLPVHELGRNARERLQSERMKRREIQRINFDDERLANLLAPNATKKSTPLTEGETNNSALIDAVNSKAAALRKKKLGQSATNGNRLTKRRRSSTAIDDKIDPKQGDSIIDRWMPDITHIINNDVDSTSDIVQLHALPIQVTRQDIIKFFIGLVIQRIILLLPSSNNKMELMDLDAKYDNVGEDDDGNDDVLPHPSIERCHPSRTGLRVLIQFTTPTNAALALQRSGEVLRINASTLQEDASSIDPSQTFGVSIALTPVSKSVAVSMIQVIGIDITKHRGTEPILQILESIVIQIDPNISFVLWNQLIDELSLNIVMLEATPDHSVPGFSISSVLKHLRKYDYFGSANTQNGQLSGPDIELLQQQKLLLEQEMDRIMTMNSIKGEQKEDDYFMMIPFLSYSGSDAHTDLYSWNNCNVPLHQNHKLRGMKDTFVCNDSILVSGRKACPVVLYFTDQYIQRLRTLIQQIETTITISRRWDISHNTKSTP